MRSLSFLPRSLLALVTRTCALRLSGCTRARDGLQQRSSMSGSLRDSQNLLYSTDITLNGAPFSVLVDTGSSDLWVSSSVPGAVPQNYPVDVSYASGSAAGRVVSATLEIAGFSIPHQFLIEAAQQNAVTDVGGVMGLGPSSSSKVRKSGNSSMANPPLDRIFTSNSLIPPQIAILLQRSSDPGNPYPGDLAIGDVLPNYQGILNQPRLPVTVVPLAGGQHWQTLLDVDGIIVNGEPIHVQTQVTGAQTKNATVILDTGFSLPQVHPQVAEAFYGNVPGAVLTNIPGLGSVWVVSCHQQFNVSFVFGGVNFPIHPLDLNFDGFGFQTDGKAYCVGAFQPYSFNIKQRNEILYDMVLGMAFLRNAYMLINLGNLIDAATPSTDTAYIQLLPITNATLAAQDFASVRGGITSATVDEIEQLFSSSGSLGSGSNPSAMPWLIGLITGVSLVLVLLIVGIVYYWRHRRVKKATPSANWPVDPPSYRPISSPSPQAAHDMHLVPPPIYSPSHVPEHKIMSDAHP